jgi:hypothetical protein
MGMGEISVGGIKKWERGWVNWDIPMFFHFSIVLLALPN